MNDILLRLQYLNKIVERVSFVLLILVLWGGLILMFTKYKSMGILVYEEYGESGVMWYFSVVIGFVFFLFYISSRIGYLIKDIKLKLKDKEEFYNA